MLVYLKTETELVFEMSYVFKKLGDGQSPKKECQLTSVGFRSLFWISWPLKLEGISRPETSVWNYHITVRNVAEDLR